MLVALLQVPSLGLKPRRLFAGHVLRVLTLFIHFGYEFIDVNLDAMPFFDPRYDLSQSRRQSFPPEAVENPAEAAHVQVVQLQRVHLDRYLLLEDHALCFAQKPAVQRLLDDVSADAFFAQPFRQLRLVHHLPSLCAPLLHHGLQFLFVMVG